MSFKSMQTTSLPKFTIAATGSVSIPALLTIHVFQSNGGNQDGTSSDTPMATRPHSDTLNGLCSRHGIDPSDAWNELVRFGSTRFPEEVPWSVAAAEGGALRRNLDFSPLNVVPLPRLPDFETFAAAFERARIQIDTVSRTAENGQGDDEEQDRHKETCTIGIDTRHVISLSEHSGTPPMNSNGCRSTSAPSMSASASAAIIHERRMQAAFESNIVKSLSTKERLPTESLGYLALFFKHVYLAAKSPQERVAMLARILENEKSRRQKRHDYYRSMQVVEKIQGMRVKMSSSSMTTPSPVVERGHKIMAGLHRRVMRPRLRNALAVSAASLPISVHSNHRPVAMMDSREYLVYDLTAISHSAAQENIISCHFNDLFAHQARALFDESVSTHRRRLQRSFGCGTLCTDVVITRAIRIRKRLVQLERGPKTPMLLIDVGDLTSLQSWETMRSRVPIGIIPFVSGDHQHQYDTCTTTNAVISSTFVTTTSNESHNINNSSDALRVEDDGNLGTSTMDRHTAQKHMASTSIPTASTTSSLPQIPPQTLCVSASHTNAPHRSGSMLTTSYYVCAFVRGFGSVSSDIFASALLTRLRGGLDTVKEMDVRSGHEWARKSSTSSTAKRITAAPTSSPPTREYYEALRRQMAGESTNTTFINFDRVCSWLQSPVTISQLLSRQARCAGMDTATHARLLNAHATCNAANVAYICNHARRHNLNWIVLVVSGKDSATAVPWWEQHKEQLPPRTVVVNAFQGEHFSTVAFLHALLDTLVEEAASVSTFGANSGAVGDVSSIDEYSVLKQRVQLLYEYPSLIM